MKSKGKDVEGRWHAASLDTLNPGRRRSPRADNGNVRTRAAPLAAPGLCRPDRPHRVHLGAGAPAAKHVGVGVQSAGGRKEHSWVGRGDPSPGLTSAASVKASPSSSADCASVLADLLLASEDRRTFRLTALNMADKTTG